MTAALDSFRVARAVASILLVCCACVALSPEQELAVCTSSCGQR